MSAVCDTDLILLHDQAWNTALKKCKKAFCKLPLDIEGVVGKLRMKIISAKFKTEREIFYVLSKNDVDYILGKANTEQKIQALVDMLAARDSNIWVEPLLQALNECQQQSLADKISKVAKNLVLKMPTNENIPLIDVAPAHPVCPPKLVLLLICDFFCNFEFNLGVQLLCLIRV